MTPVPRATIHRNGAGPGAWFLAFDRRLRETVPGLILAPVQLGLRLWIFFGLPFVASGLTKWEVLPFLKPELLAWNGAPRLASGALYQFSNVCEFCFNIRIWGTEAAPLVHWMLPAPQMMAMSAGLLELLLPALVLIGLATRLSALFLLGMTVVIQLVVPWGLVIHMGWAVALLGVVVLGPGVASLDHLAARLRRR